MSSAKMGASKLMGLMLVGGFITGGVMAMTTPTQMKREVTNWRQAIGVRDIAVSETTIPIYAPPQDLTPVHWLPAADEYTYAPAPEPWVDTTSDLMPDAIDDTAGQVVSEQLPAEILAGRTSDPAVEDAAGTSAQAAQAAASHVRSVQSAASVVTVDAPPASEEIAGTT